MCRCHSAWVNCIFELPHTFAPFLCTNLIKILFIWNALQSKPEKLQTRGYSLFRVFLKKAVTFLNIFRSILNVVHFQITSRRVVWFSSLRVYANLLLKRLYDCQHNSYVPLIKFIYSMHEFKWGIWRLKSCQHGYLRLIFVDSFVLVSMCHWVSDIPYQVLTAVATRKLRLSLSTPCLVIPVLFESERPSVWELLPSRDGPRPRNSHTNLLNQ